MAENKSPTVDLNVMIILFRGELYEKAYIPTRRIRRSVSLQGAADDDPEPRYERPFCVISAALLLSPVCS